MRGDGQVHADGRDTVAGTLVGGFERWVEAAASELAYFANLELTGEGRSMDGSEGSSVPPEAAVSFLLSKEVLGESGGQGMPGYYERAEDVRLAGQNMLYVLYGAAWRELDGVRGLRSEALHRL